MIRVLIADDHPIVRHGLRQLLADQPDMAPPGEAETGQQVLDLVRQGQWDVVVLDISLPGLSGLDVLREIDAHRPQLPVLMLSVHAEDQYALRSFRAGAAGYLTKLSAPDELLEALHKLLAGGKYVSRSFAEMLVTALEPGSSQPPHEALSDREYEVLRRLATGQSVTHIAEALGLSVKTVSTYRRRLMEKLGLASSVALVQYAREYGLTEG